MQIGPIPSVVMDIYLFQIQNNPDIHYCESQYCGLRRYDRTTGNSISIKPQPTDR